MRALIHRGRRQVCGDDAAARRDFRVHLVAHSMGGLVCRCLLQNDAVSDAADRALVDKVFTYATPHNGIEMAGINVPAFLGLWDLNNFNRAEMAKYLDLPECAERVDTLNGRAGRCSSRSSSIPAALPRGKRSILFTAELALSTTGYTIDNSFRFDEHLPGEYLFRDTVSLRLTPGPDGWTLYYTLGDEGWGEGRGKKARRDVEGHFVIPLESKKGFRGRLRLRVNA